MLIFYRMLALILSFALITRLWRINYPTNYYFDEVYNAFTTQEFVKGNKDAYEWFHTTSVPGTAYGWTHPPLAKLLGGVGILVFGDNSLGWRIVNVFIGVGIIYLVYLISLDLLGLKNFALLATALAATDGLLLVQSRINMNDIVATFFILLSFWAFVKYQLKTTRFSLLRLGFVLGLLISTKWTGLYAILVFGVWIGLQNIFHIKKWPAIFAALVIIPAAIYLLSYSQYFILGGSWKNFLELQNQMWWYNTTLKATHTYQSDWWTWPLMIRPVWYFVNYGSQTIANIYAMGNPLLWWFGLPAIFYTLYSALKTKSWRPWIILTGFLSFWLPWARTPRIMFLYHYLPSVPFLCIALAYSLQKLNNRVVTLGTCGFILVAFVYFYPHWTGIPVSTSWANHYYWLSSWR